MHKGNKLVITNKQPRNYIIHDVFQCLGDKVQVTMSKHFLCRSIYKDHTAIKRYQVVYTGTTSLMMQQNASSQNNLTMPRNVKEDSKVSLFLQK